SSTVECLYRIIFQKSSQKVKGHKTAEELFNFILSKVNETRPPLERLILTNDDDSSDVLDYLTNIAYEFSQKRDPSLLEPFLKILTREQMRHLLWWWYKNNNLRRLWLFGLTNKEIKFSGMSQKELYEACIKNPYKVAIISLEKC